TFKLYQQQGKLFSSIITDLFLNTPNLRLNILRDQAKRYGVSATTIETLLRNAYSQNYIYLIKKTDDQYQLILETNDDARRHPDDLARLYVNSHGGSRTVPLSAVATWEPVTGPATVNHINQFPSVTLNFNLMPGVTIGEATKYIEDSAREVVPSHMRSGF